MAVAHARVEAPEKRSALAPRRGATRARGSALTGVVLPLRGKGDDGPRSSDVLLRVEEATPRAFEPLAAPFDFEAVYVRYFAAVAAWLRAFGVPTGEVEDIAQEVFLVVRRKLVDFEGSHLAPWLYRVAQRMASDHRRRAWFRRILLDSESRLDSFPSQYRQPDAVYQLREAEAILWRLLGKMSRVRRTAFVLFEIEGYSCAEIAELEGIPINTVYTRLHHARATFLELVAEHAEQQRSTGGKA